MGAQQFGNGLTAFVQNFLPALQALQERQRASKGTALNLQELSSPQQSPVSTMPPMQAAPDPQMQLPPMGTPQQAPPSMPSPMGGPNLAAQIGPLIEMLRGGGSLPGAQVPGGTPSPSGVPQAMGASTGGGPQPAAQPPMAPQQQQQQQPQRDPNVSAVAQPTGQGVIADGNANLRAIVTGLRKMDPNASPDTIMRATMERIQMLKGVQPEVKDAMMMQMKYAQIEQNYYKVQEQKDTAEKKLEETTREHTAMIEQRDRALAQSGLQFTMKQDGTMTLERMRETAAAGRVATQQGGLNDRLRYGEAQKNTRLDKTIDARDRTASANRDLKRILGDNTNLTGVAKTYMKSHPSATPEAAAAYAKKIAPPGGGGGAPSSGPSSAQVSELKKYRSNPAATKSFDQRFGKGAAARALASK